MPKVVDHDQRRQEIADVVLAVIAESGIKAVTTKIVAERSGWSTGVINHYFLSHRDLLLVALRRAAEIQGRRYRELRTKTADADPITRLNWLFQSSLPIDAERIAMIRVFLVFYAEASWNPTAQEEIVDYLNSWRRLVERVVREAQDCGQIDKKFDAHELAVGFVGLTDGLAIHGAFDDLVLRQATRLHDCALELVEGQWRLVQPGLKGHPQLSGAIDVDLDARR
ncbi:TetR/AcrR family transcriptional regulator [Arthrobacter sp. 2MCAF15]|uniref:TetR/AcrR family transcriptional regulator n=1 Tax=Arthrobacter sp. 2MCAF15 TaxID=3232984 RepID=UPI003F90A94C